MTEPLVSVVVPTFDRAYCICKTLDSVLAQTHPNLEILVVDDGSTDGTRELLARTYANEPRVRYVHQRNQGVSAARNRGLALAAGEFIALLDSDDVWMPWKLEAQLACMHRFPEVGMIWTDMDAIGPDGDVVARRFLTKMYSAYKWFPRDELFERSLRLSEFAPEMAASLDDPRLYIGDIFSPMVMGNLVHTSTVLLRRERLEKVKGFSLELRHSGEDYDFHLRTCREGLVAYLDVVGILYQRGREDQLTFGSKFSIHTAHNFLKTIGPVIERDRARIDLPQWMIDEVLAQAHAWIGEEHLGRSEHRQARTHLAKTLRYKARQPRMVGFLALSLLPPRVVDSLRRAYRRAKSAIVGEPHVDGSAEGRSFRARTA